MISRPIPARQVGACAAAETEIPVTSPQSSAALNRDRHRPDKTAMQHKSRRGTGVEQVLLTPLSNRRVTVCCKFIHVTLAGNRRLLKEICLPTIQESNLSVTKSFGRISSQKWHRIFA
jgi:hypothetical protein